MKSTLSRTAIDNSITQRRRTNVPRPLWILEQVVVWAALYRCANDRIPCNFKVQPQHCLVDSKALSAFTWAKKAKRRLGHLGIGSLACCVPMLPKVLVIPEVSESFCNDGGLKLRQERFQRFEKCQFSSDQTCNNGFPLHMLHLGGPWVERNSLASVTMSWGPRVRQMKNRFVLTCWLCD